MNVRRGFNRLFLVVWIVWVLVVVWWGMNFVARDRAAFDEMIYEGEHGRSWDRAYRATESELANWRKRREEATFRHLASEFITTRDGLQFLVILLAALPAIIYAVLFGTGWAAGWIYRGFRGIDQRGPKGSGR